MATPVRDFFKKEEKEAILNAIREAELNTSGEIRLHLEATCKEDVLNRAAHLFSTLQMHKTKLRNGVLIYLSVHDRKLAILGDAGINKVVPEGFWEAIKDTIIEHFLQGDFAGGLIEGILRTGEQLKKYFPHQKDDINELKDDISYGEPQKESNPS